ncbi:hypothetical protein K4L06_00185 [Lysobacter sp. BMK333-48F3]|uniref:hypothetical protein n=1 Tax=Lysobacter sp. BMK333-48F3 TaxID=2867962 RepID=UPI001C8C268C|nr:hypothetical protein [Lysobacter sp. BMK333-48F3]MBX9399708.1 hypothetical protein [Lysobacter sp. BMK333-48F3]
MRRWLVPSVVAAFALAAIVLLLVACGRNDPPNAAPATTATVPAPIAAPPTASPPTASAEPAGIDYVLPGALAPDVGPEQLRRLFGAANVKIDDTLPGPEDESFRGVVLFDGDPTRRAVLHYQDEKKLRGLAVVEVREPTTRWRLDNGVAIGQSLAELVRRNGKPIRFSGLDWDYGGTVTDWNGGKLGSGEGDAVMRHARLDVQPQPGRDDGVGAVPTGDSEYASDDPKYPRQGELLRVSEIGVSFPGEDDL